MQGIVSCLVLGEYGQTASVWLDFALGSLGNDVKKLVEQTHRRFIKTHLPLDGLPFYDHVRYIVVSRNPRDVFMSLWNHYNGYTTFAYEEINNRPGRVGPPQPVCPSDIREFWKMWITRGWFEWEDEGYPFWSTMRHVQTWWDHRHRSNILFVHYNHLKEDIAGQIRRIADYLGIEASEDLIDLAVRSTTIDAMRDSALEDQKEREAVAEIFKDGAHSFYYKGTNNRWKDVLTADDLALYEAAAERNLSKSCRAWLEEGEGEEAKASQRG
jgi:aryl sulfotransferase